TCEGAEAVAQDADGPGDLAGQRAGLRRRLHVVAAAVEEPRAEFGLQAADLLADGAVGDAQFLRPAAVAALAGGGFERAQSDEGGQASHGSVVSPDYNFGQKTSFGVGPP